MRAQFRRIMLASITTTIFAIASAAGAGERQRANPGQSAYDRGLAARQALRNKASAVRRDEIRNETINEPLVVKGRPRRTTVVDGLTMVIREPVITRNAPAAPLRVECSEGGSRVLIKDSRVIVRSQIRQIGDDGGREGDDVAAAVVIDCRGAAGAVEFFIDNSRFESFGPLVNDP